MKYDVIQKNEANADLNNPMNIIDGRQRVLKEISETSAFNTV